MGGVNFNRDLLSNNEDHSNREITTCRLSWQAIENRESTAGSQAVRRFVLGWQAVRRRPKLARSLVQFATKYPHISWRFECQRHAVARNPPNLQDNVVAHMNPFTHFPTKYQHLKLLPFAHSCAYTH